jgi:hypothetical protein
LVQNAPRFKNEGTETEPPLLQTSSVFYRAVKFSVVADVTVGDAAVFCSPELNESRSSLSADGLAKYLFDWKAPVGTKGLDEP